MLKLEGGFIGNLGKVYRALHSWLPSFCYSDGHP